LKRQKQRFNFAPEQLNDIKRRIRCWANQYSILLFLDSNEYNHTQSKYECICATEDIAQIIGSKGDCLKNVSHYHQQHNDWLFGHINYDYKNHQQGYHLSSKHHIRVGFPDIYFFRPKVVCYIPSGLAALTIESYDVSPEDVWNEIHTIILPEEKTQQGVSFQKRIQQQEYLNILQQLRKHIIEGDCYEINFCNEAFCEAITIDPLLSFENLNQISPAPFAAYYKLNDKYLLCASPERYLLKQKNTIIAQPIKGTAKRSTDKAQDYLNKIALQQSIKERAENVMIVDLMRNDLARFCEVGSVNVEELFGIYSFPQVHHLISTISGTLRKELNFSDAINYSFPMGSMTGAPKLIVMQLIEQYEKARRELFSGSVGYISPEANFDFNVVIRSLFYNSSNKYLSYQTGGAITFESDAEQEWEETLLKASAMERIFSNNA
jgi:para-aminobenzoate synthetase component I